MTLKEIQDKLKAEGKCPECHGRGKRLLKHEERVGMSVDGQTLCPTCNGSGEYIMSKCTICNTNEATHRPVFGAYTCDDCYKPNIVIKPS